MRVLTSMVFILLIMASPIRAAATEYVFAVIPNIAVTEIEKKWKPLMDHLGRRTGNAFRLRMYESIDKFLAASSSGEPDFIYTAPNMYYLAYEAQHYVPLIRSSRMFRGKVFVRKDAPYQSVKELEGKTVSFVGPKNLCSVFVRHALAEGSNPINFNKSFTGNSVNVAKAVLVGKADAGVSLDLNIEEDFPELMPQLRIIFQTQPVASHPVAAHPRVPSKLRRQVTDELLALNKTPEGSRLLAAAGLRDPVQADLTRDYSIFGSIRQP